uniref:Uncharacterized protein n=1 Tax=Arundo donax TaxID=35708 RepID=A0A0A8YQD0_ARUDO
MEWTTEAQNNQNQNYMLEGKIF